MKVEQFTGHYRGQGSWHEINGNSAGYEIEQSIEAASDGIKLWLKHNHADGTVSELRFTLKPSLANLYLVEAFDKEVGFGFIMHDTLRFHLNNKFLKADLDSVTEISFRRLDSKRLECYGTSTKNSAGNYIMWYEELTRVD
jgi:hypothetical protein